MLPILALLFFDGEDTCAVPPTEVVPAFFASPAIGIQSGQITGVIHQFSNHIECGQPLVAREPAQPARFGTTARQFTATTNISD